MSGLSIAFRAALLALLQADVAVAAATEGRVFAGLPSDYPGPYLAFSAWQRIADGADGIDGSEVYLTLIAWSQEPSGDPAAEIADAVRAAIDGVDLGAGGLVVDGFRVVILECQSVRIADHSDGLSRFTTITLHALVDAL